MAAGFGTGGFARRTSIAFFLASAALPASVVMAEAPGGASATPADAQAPQDEIVVTAQKRAQVASDVGITINAYSASQLKDAGVVNAVDLVKVTPALNLAGSSAGQSLSFSIRGVTQEDFAMQAEAPVAVYVDDGYLASNNAAVIGLFDLDHVEVLKGPQGTLFGRNATGGLVNIITKKPGFTDSGYVTGSYASHNDGRLEAAFGGPINDTIAFRLSGAYEHVDNYIKNISPIGQNVGGSDSLMLRGQILLKPAETFQLLLSAYDTRITSAYSPYYSASTRNVTDAAGNLINSVIVNGPTLLGTTPTRGGHNVIDSDDARDSGNYNKLLGGTAKATWDIGPELTSVTDYKSNKQSLNLDADSTGSNFASSYPHGKVDNFSQELRLFQDSGRFRWYVGGYYLHINADIPEVLTAFPAFGVVYNDRYALKTNSYAGFAQAEYDVLPKVTMTGGIRVTRELKSFNYASDLYSYSATNKSHLDALLGPSRPSYSGKSSDTLVTAKAEVQYHPSRDLLVYGGWTRGAKAGSFNAPFAGGTTFPDSLIPYKPETLNAYEVGTKLALADRAIRLDASVFYYDYKNYQAFQAQDLSNFVVSRPAKTYGAEVSATITPVAGVTLVTGASYTHNRVKNVSIDALNYTRIAPFTSKWKVTQSARYEWTQLNGRMAVQGDMQYLSSFYFSLTNFDSTKVKGYTLFDGRISWTDEANLWSVAIFGDNLLNKHYRTVGFDLSGLCGCSENGYGRTRWAGASITRNF